MSRLAGRQGQFLAPVNFGRKADRPIRSFHGVEMGGAAGENPLFSQRC